MKGKKLWGDTSVRLLPSDFNFQELQEFSASQKSWQWRNLSLFLKRGIEQQLFHETRISSLWLEFDIGSSNSWPPQPNLILGVGNCQKDSVEIAEEAFYFLRGKKPSKKSLSIMRQCLTEGFHIKTLAFMLARSSNALRFSLGNPSFLSSSGFSAYLKSIGHPGLDESTLRLYSQLKPFLQKTECSLRIEECVLPRIDWGISHLGKKFGSRLTEWWDQILKTLVFEKLIDEQKCPELLAWIGEQIEPESGLLLAKRIGQIKFISFPQKPLQAKAYFGVLVGGL